MDVPLLSMSDISKLAQVARAVVTTWRRRYPDFPEPIDHRDARLLFDGHEVTQWLADRGLGNASPDVLHEELAVHAISSCAVEFGPRSVIEIIGSLLCLQHFDQRELPSEWGDILYRAERLDADDEFLLRELRTAEASALRLARLAEDLVEAAFSPYGAHESLLSEPSRLGLTGLAESFLTSEMTHLMTGVADLPSRLDAKERVTIADPYGGAGDLLIPLTRQTEDCDALTIVAADHCEWLARLTRRRLLLAGIDEIRLDVQVGLDLEERMGDPDLVVTRLPYEPGETRSVRDILTKLDRIGLLLTPRATAIVIGPANALIDRLNGVEEARLRSGLLREGLVESIVALPGGIMPYRPGYRAAMWVMTRNPVTATRGRVLVCDISGESLNERVRAQLTEDILLWRTEGYHAHSHTPRYGRALRIADLDAIRGESVTPAAVRLRVATPDDRPARISQAAVRLAQAVQLSDAQTADGMLAPSVVERTTRFPRLITIGELIADRRVRKLKGHRIHSEHIRRDGHHMIIGPEETAGTVAVGDRKIDRLIYAARYENARLTLPGDVVYGREPHLGVLVDHDGYNVIAAPARGLRVRPDAARPLTPRVLAALLTAAQGTRRSPGAVRAGRIEDVAIPDLEPDEVRHFDELLAALDERERPLRNQLDELAEIRRLTCAGLADGTLTINPTQPERGDDATT